MTENQKSTMIKYLRVLSKYNLMYGKLSNNIPRWKYLADFLNSMPGIVKDWKN